MCLNECMCMRTLTKNSFKLEFSSEQSFQESLLINLIALLAKEMRQKGGEELKSQMSQ